MNYIEPIYKEVLDLRSELEDIIDYAMFDNEDEIRNMIRQRWLTGKRPDGSLIGWYRSETYANQKYSQNSSAGFGNADLTLTGALGRGIVISGFNGEYEIYSNDSKYEEIVENWGEWNFNISEEEKRVLFDNIIKVIFDKLNIAYR